MKNFLTNVFGFIIYNSATSVFEKKIFSFFCFFLTLNVCAPVATEI